VALYDYRNISLHLNAVALYDYRNISLHLKAVVRYDTEIVLRLEEEGFV
jgi:hypothetical protein